MEWFRDTKSTNYGLNLTCKSRIETERSANLLLTAALTIFTLWLLGLSLKGTEGFSSLPCIFTYRIEKNGQYK